MKYFCLSTLSFLIFVSCAEENKNKPVGPVSSSTKIPWNAPLPGQGGGQFSILPQNQYRR